MPIRSVLSRPVAVGCRWPKTAATAAAGTTLANRLARMEGEYGDSLRALHYIAVAIHNYHDSGALTRHANPSGYPRRFLTGWAATNPRPPSRVARQVPSPWRHNPELRTATAHLRTVLGDQSTSRSRRKGETMSTAEIAAYAYDQIDQARAELCLEIADLRLAKVRVHRPAFRGSDVSVHRRRGFDPSVGGRRRCHAHGPRCTRQGVAQRHRVALRFLFNHTGDGVARRSPRRGPPWTPP